MTSPSSTIRSGILADVVLEPGLHEGEIHQRVAVLLASASAMRVIALGPIRGSPVLCIRPGCVEGCIVDEMHCPALAHPLTPRPGPRCPRPSAACRRRMP
jgi:hypothetical protein